MSAEHSLSFSPCPNDCFMFDALVNKRMPGLPPFRVHMADIEALNLAALGANGPDITKISAAALPAVLPQYRLLDAGAALGFGTGPLLVSASLENVTAENIAYRSVAVPGIHTTAFALFRYAMGNKGKISEVLFSEIEEAVLSGKHDLGVIIHESRFTYAEKGLHACMDLGAYWEEHTGFPVPLGVIVIKRSIEESVAKSICGLLRDSVKFAFSHPDASASFVAENAQEMDKEVCKRHIDLYVNEFSVSLGKTGTDAIIRLMQLLGKELHPEKDVVTP